MTREIAHFQMFSAALADIAPNFPPGVLQGDPRFTHTYFNMSNGEEVRGPWNEGPGPWQDGGEWNYIDKPISHVRETEGLVEQPIMGSGKTDKETRSIVQQLSETRKEEVTAAVKPGEMQWCEYRQPAGSGQRRAR